MTRSCFSLVRRCEVHYLVEDMAGMCVLACVCMLNRVQLFMTQWTVDHQTLLSTEFSRQEYWSELPFPTPGIFLTQEFNPCLLCFCIGRWILCHCTTWEAQQAGGAPRMPEGGAVLQVKISSPSKISTQVREVQCINGNYLEASGELQDSLRWRSNT